jgi:glutamate dehydrogenase/leucine dehydrogenase
LNQTPNADERSLALSVLISGAGIAGLALARPLALAGHRVVAVDRARQFDSRGYGITIKGTGVQVLRHTGIYDALLAHRFMFDRIRGFDKSGNRVREYRTDEAEEKLGRTKCNSRIKAYGAFDSINTPAKYSSNIGIVFELLQQSFKDRVPSELPRLA